MARSFDDALTEYLQIESAVVSAYPIGMACWYNTNDAAVDQLLIWVGDKDVTNYWTGLYLNASDDKIYIFSHEYGGTYKYVATADTFATNTWEHAAAMCLSVSERHVYLNGGNKGTSTGTVGAMANHDRTAIGGARDSSDDAYMSGHIAEVAIWDLTAWGANDAAREVAFEKAIASMAKGYTPEFYPLGRLAYWPLIRGLNDKGSGGFNLTANGTTVSTHPGIIRPSKIWVPHIAVGAPPGVTVPVMYHHYQMAGGGG